MNFRITYPINRISNLSFFGSERADNRKVLLVDSEGNYKECLNVPAAAASLNTSKSNINNCINGKTRSIKGYTVVRADDFLINNGGKQEYDLEEIKKYAQSKFIDGERRSIINKELVAFNTNGFKSRIYKNIREAAKELYCGERSIQKCADGKSHTCVGNVILWADDILNEKGEIDFEKGKKLARERINPKFDSANGLKNRKVRDKKLIAYTDDFQPTVFDNLDEAQSKLYCTRQTLTNCADGKAFTSMGMTFFWEDELLDKNDNIDLEKGKKLAEQRFEKRAVSLIARSEKAQKDNAELYKKSVISYDAVTFEHEILGTINEFCKANPKYDKSYIVKSATGKSCTYKGKIFVFEEEIAEYGPDGKKVLNIKKGRTIAKRRMEAKTAAYSEARKNALSKKSRKS